MRALRALSFPESLCAFKHAHPYIGTYTQKRFSQVWNVEKAQPLAVCHHPAYVYCARFCPGPDGLRGDTPAEQAASACKYVLTGCFDHNREFVVAWLCACVCVFSCANPLCLCARGCALVAHLLHADARLLHTCCTRMRTCCTLVARGCALVARGCALVVGGCAHVGNLPCGVYKNACMLRERVMPATMF
jgi:hypothetical protein